MFAIIELGGSQLKLEKDQVFLTNRTENKAGTEFKLDKVLATGDGAKLQLGTPYVASASVTLKVLEELRGKKVRGFTYKRKTGQRRAWGHRQELQKMQVVSISG
ncbi:MAG: 50S ribosomal protein L21 [Spirochaetales bacterium]|nr:50S ribosomal protein L21 [Spirochaetales bacterium]